MTESTSDNFDRADGEIVAPWSTSPGRLYIAPVDSPDDWTEVTGLQEGFEWDFDSDWLDEIETFQFANHSIEMKIKMPRATSVVLMFLATGVKPRRKRNRKIIDSYITELAKLRRKLERINQRRDIGIGVKSADLIVS